MVKIASCQWTPAAKIKARKDQINNILLKCEAEHMDFICFPEGFLPGYWPMMENPSAQGIAAFMIRMEGKWQEVVKAMKTRDVEYMAVHFSLKSSIISHLI